MSIWEKVQHRYVLLEVLAKSKVHILKELSECLSVHDATLDAVKVFDALLHREKLSSTAIGASIAIPHARLDNLKETYVLIAKSSTGVDFDAIDEKPVHLIFCVLSPEKNTEDHLKLLARVSKFLHDPSFKEQLIKAKSEDEVLKILNTKDSSY